MANPVDPGLADLGRQARELDAVDPLAKFAAEFVRPASVLAYLDGNSLGRPLKSTGEQYRQFVEAEWGERLIRSWDERWCRRALAVGDRIGTLVLGAATGQTAVADSTTVLLYKMVRAGVAFGGDRSEIVVDTENFPTDRYIVEAVAAERGLTVRWLEPDPATGVTVDEVQGAISEQTALVVLSHVSYKSAYIADLPAITAAVHEVGALILWDLCHSVGVVEVDLDAADVDLAVGCTYKYLNGGPGSPAFGYVARRLHDDFSQPISGWMGHRDPFAMGPGYHPSSGIRRVLSGTPNILGMLPLMGMLELIERAGLDRIRAKSVQLTDFVIRAADTYLPQVTMASPRAASERGGHVLLMHPDMRRIVAELWEIGVIPDFRNPNGLRAGLSPLSTTFAEVALAVRHLQARLVD